MLKINEHKLPQEKPVINSTSTPCYFSPLAEIPGSIE